MELQSKQVSTENNRKMTVRWLKMEEGDFFTTGDAAIMLGISQNTIRSHVKNHGLLIVQNINDQKDYLTRRNVIKFRDNRSKLVPKDTLKALVKIVNSPEAWAIYNQLYDAATNPEAHVALQMEMHGEAGLAAVQNAIDQVADMSRITYDQRTHLRNLMADVLLANNLPAFENKTNREDKWVPGTLNSFRKIILKRLGAGDLPGNQLELFILNQGNYNDICTMIAEIEFTAGELNTLRWVTRKAQELLP